MPGTLAGPSPRYLSCGVYEEGYLGGAHPYHRTSSLCFDLTAGRQVESLSGLFTDWSAARALLLAEIQSQLKYRMPYEDGHAEYDRALENADRYLDDAPFFLEEDGLTIYYNEYALAAYVCGSFEFLIPYESLEDLLIS